MNNILYFEHGKVIRKTKQEHYQREDCLWILILSKKTNKWEYIKLFFCPLDANEKEIKQKIINFYKPTVRFITETEAFICLL